MPKETSEQKEKHTLAGAGGGWFFGSRERHVWRAREGCGVANAVQSRKLVDCDLTKGFKTFKQLSNDSHAEEHSKPVANIGPI